MAGGGGWTRLEPRFAVSRISLHGGMSGAAIQAPLLPHSSSYSKSPVVHRPSLDKQRKPGHSRSGYDLAPTSAHNIRRRVQVMPWRLR